MDAPTAGAVIIGIMGWIGGFYWGRVVERHKHTGRWL